MGMPMGMPGFNGGFNGGGGPGMMNPFFGPQMPSRSGMQQFDNRDQRNNQQQQQQQANSNRNPNANNANSKNNGNANSRPRDDSQPQEGEQQRSLDRMLNNMGLPGVQPFYTSLTNELLKTPTGMGLGGQQDAAPSVNY